jgi:class 3 adenylate cyclase
MRYGPPFKFARRQDGRRVAYQVVGDGELDLVFLFGWPTHLGLMWEDPSFAAFLRKLSSFSRLILYDRSGGGLSDRGQGGYLFEDEMDDVRAADHRASRYMAERIPGARFVALPGQAHFPFLGDQDTVVQLTQEFLTGATPVVEPDRVLATVLFTDIVNSTRLAAELRDLELEVRVGLHTGECGLLGNDIGGIAVHIAARVLGQAGAGEIVCSRTVKDLVAGSGFVFADRGTRRLKRAPDSWQLYAVELAGP